MTPNNEPHRCDTPSKTVSRRRRTTHKNLILAAILGLALVGCATTGTQSQTEDQGRAQIEASITAPEVFETTSSIDTFSTPSANNATIPISRARSSLDTRSPVSGATISVDPNSPEPTPVTEVRAGNELAFETSEQAPIRSRDGARTARYSLVDCELKPGEAEQLEERTEVLHYRPTETCYGPCRLFAVEAARPDIEVPPALALRDRDGDWTTDLSACPSPRR